MSNYGIHPDDIESLTSRQRQSDPFGKLLALSVIEGVIDMPVMKRETAVLNVIDQIVNQWFIYVNACITLNREVAIDYGLSESDSASDIQNIFTG